MPLSESEWLKGEREIIDKFFSTKVPGRLGPGPGGTICTEADCIQLAQKILGTRDIQPVDNQGANSFTLSSKSKSQVVQFRLEPFKDDMLQLAARIYGSQISVAAVPSHAVGFPLPVYTSNVIPGKVHILQDFPDHGFPLARQQQTVADLAKFIALSSHFPQPRSACDVDGWTTTAPQVVDQLLGNKSLQLLAPALVPILTDLKTSIHLLDTLPLVLTHHDLSELNIFVDQDGHVTGVIDFETATIEAFGMAMWGIYECFLGGMEDGKFAFFNQVTAESGSGTVRESLEGTFWQTLWSSVSPELSSENERAVRAALAIGVIRRYFIRGMLGNIDPSDRVHAVSLEYAKGILPAVWL
ncbi:hypothetical protein K461DRAFT_311977 [Myriangium duriaei CBS 260.36]|uniref:Aminoglycoside phosphotransferase domain-containing protein n=1 Tax=Myriangium duriaei CBS 260.36 TaxID=1168546 RepID=A0A9P4MNQ9_9PEZI|nr:hypothetical protein K461DRAFT_311977 [Myriangium duriaei CBS 260.36]